MEFNFDEYEFSQSKNLDKKIKPYLEALTLFTNIDKISKNFSKIYRMNNKNRNLPDNFDSLQDFIKFFKINNVLTQNGEDLQKRKEKIYIQNSPEKVFYFFLDELHKIFKKNIGEEEEKENDKIRAIEYDRDKANKSFNEFFEKDRSTISDLFFGIKLIIKTCKNCSMTQYSCKYIKAIPLNVEKITSELDLEKLISSVEKSFEIEDLCQMCSNKQKLNVQIKITKHPKILILIFKNYKKEVEIKLERSVKICKKKYHLISTAIVSKPGILDCIFKCGKKQCKTLYDESSYIFKRKIPKGTPYVLFYKNMEDTQNDNIYCNENDFDGILIENEKSQATINNNEINNINLGEETNYGSNEKLRGKKDICFYFTFPNSKQLYIDTDDCQKFYNIIEQLKQKYDLSNEDINEQKVHYKGKKINCLKCPRELGLEDGTDIQVY